MSEGELVALVGESGCGKTVLLKHLNALLTPTEGKVAVHGMTLSNLDGNDLKALRRSTGMVFQNSALFDSMTIGENLAMAAHWSPPLQNSQKENIRLNLKRVGLGEIGHLYPAALSGGMKKRVAIARALMMKPELLLYDEPTTGLDPKRAYAIMDLIESINHEDGITSLVVTHDLSCIHMFDRVVMMHEGRIHFEGAPFTFMNTNDTVVKDYLGISTVQISESEGNHDFSQ